MRAWNAPLGNCKLSSFTSCFLILALGTAIARSSGYGIRNYRYLYERRVVRASLPGGLHPSQAGRARFCGGSAALRESHRLHRLRSLHSGLPHQLDLYAGRAAGRIRGVCGVERQSLQLKRKGPPINLARLMAATKLAEPDVPLRFSWRAWRLGERSIFQAIDDARNTVLDQGYVEIDQQAKPLVRQPQIGEQLFLVHGRDLRDRLDFDDHAVLDHQIGAKPHFEASAFVDYGDHLLLRDAQSALL